MSYSLTAVGQEEAGLDKCVIDSIEMDIDESVFACPQEVMPQPKIGMEAYIQYVRNNVNCPETDGDTESVGKIFVQFTVEKTGQLTEFKVPKSTIETCNEEAINVIKAGPAWQPGTQRGIPVRTRMIVPISIGKLE